MNSYLGGFPVIDSRYFNQFVVDDFSGLWNIFQENCICPNIHNKEIQFSRKNFKLKGSEWIDINLPFLSPSKDFPVREFRNEKLNWVPFTQFESHLASISKIISKIEKIKKTHKFPRTLPRIGLLSRLSIQQFVH